MGCNHSEGLSGTSNISRCNKCVCNILRRLRRGTEVDVFLSGNVLEDVVFLDFNNANCCARFRGEDEGQQTTIFVDCRDILALQIES